MPSALKLQVWSALIVLSSAFPACPEVHHTMSLLINYWTTCICSLLSIVTLSADGGLGDRAATAPEPQ